MVHLRREGPVIVQINPHDVVLDDVVADLMAAARSTEAGVCPDAGIEAGKGRKVSRINYSLNGKAVNHDFVGQNLEVAVPIANHRFTGDRHGARPRINAGLSSQDCERLINLH